MSKARLCNCGSKISANMPSTINLCKNCGYNHYLVIFPDGSAKMVTKTTVRPAWRPTSGDTFHITMEQLRECQITRG